MGVKLGINTLNAVRETSGRSGYGTPPLIGNCAISEGNHISRGPVVGELNGGLAQHRRHRRMNFKRTCFTYA